MFAQIFQVCFEILDTLQSGDFGPTGKSAADDYRKTCEKFFPYAIRFRGTVVNCNNNHSDKTESLEETVEP